ncbi:MULTISPECIES: NifU family protein [Halobacterium]|uniref:NifU C-terminal domain protein n=4 Tax=Halobacterium salinarum TaxID=2242 RepID=Q9HMX9_HALSA|nr:MULTISPECIES: NifU family protein [Halobacterium]AAG20442.1 conserved hypothetical protein [Halobacterium salinarum NRC-1]MBB6089628.1 Fe-S cluster biogenesis protein NfuA [Halobacterium salinarum]MCF2164376.1 NifU family protein [Halobacterium salinarum]MCF2167163.1 NifU family protein [Halobacterium salinarum]MCF2207184.1 NifU family protein [Halobacterium salinarum]
MSAESQDGSDLEERVDNFLRRNFPQIQMHGGTAAVQNINREDGVVDLQLGGACSGCGISPMTIQAIKSRMTKEIPEIDVVNAGTGMGDSSGMTPSFPGEDGDTEESAEDEGPQAPF